ncbi:hypothetical protein PR003_g29705 [Phytophthora rubi]|uniref:Uncharacterized protein n=1 Tax=Phytophthora rubi TaxID=129364 RepID=A0A6A4BHA0_9STRA|nr:hypothetical protein PR003_g29705 [Phytophthora rubi]
MEKFMDHYGNVAAERKLRTPGSKVRALPSSKRRTAAWRRLRSRLVATSELEHGKLRLPRSKRGSVGAPEVAGGVRARAWHAAATRQQAATKLVASCKQRMPSFGRPAVAATKLVTSVKHRMPSFGRLAAAAMKLVTSVKHRMPSFGRPAAGACSLRRSCRA